MGRASMPLNKKARAAADDAFYAKHKELIKDDGSRIPLDPADPKQEGLRDEWLKLYEKNGGKVESGLDPAKKTDDPVQSCPTKLKVLAIALQTKFALCEPATFKAYLYIGTPTDADKKRIRWMIRDAKTKKDLKAGQGTNIEEKGDKLIINCVPFDWRGRTIEVAAQFDAPPQQKMTAHTPTSAEVLDWIATIQKAEAAYPKLSGVEMTNAMRALAHYDGPKFQKMYGGSPPGMKLAATGSLTTTDINRLVGWTRHTSATTGIVKDCDGDALAGGHVLTGISAGVYRLTNIDLVPWYGGPAGEKMDNLYATTIAGDLGQAAVFVNEGKQKKPYIGSHGDADEAELIGDIDGFNLGSKEPKGGSKKKLSEILLDYYCSCKIKDNYRERTSMFFQNDKKNTKRLKEQVRRFASTYIYAVKGKWGGIWSEITTEADEATAEFMIWAKKRTKLEAARVKKFEANKKKIRQ